MEERGAEEVLAELLLTEVPEDGGKPAGLPLGGIVYRYPDRQGRETVLSESRQSAEEWEASLPDLLARIMPAVGMPGRYAVYVTASGKRHTKDLHLAGGFEVNEELGVGGIGESGAPVSGRIGVALKGDLEALTQARQLEVAVSAIAQMKDVLVDVLSCRHEEQKEHHSQLMELFQEIRRERELLMMQFEERVQGLEAADLEWQRTKAKMLEAAPGQAMELMGTVVQALAKKDDE